jgi:HSP20 family protein
MSIIPRLRDDLFHELENYAPGMAGSFLGDLRRFGHHMNHMVPWYPAMDVVERPNQTEVTVDIPGMTPEHVRLSLRGNKLVIHGERKEERKEEGDDYQRYERRYGSFTRTVPVYDGTTQESIQARYRNGVLHITIPRPDAANVPQGDIPIAVQE